MVSGRSKRRIAGVGCIYGSAYSGGMAYHDQRGSRIFHSGSEI